MKSVFEIKLEFIKKLVEKKFVIDKTGQRTIEIINANFIADETSIFGEVNNKYLEQELDWYDTKKLTIHSMKKPIPDLWKAAAGKLGRVNSNYGNLVYSPINYSQFTHVVEELENNYNSRRAIMIYTRPTMHFDYKAHGMNDFICTNTVQYLVRDGKLIVIVNMRSNDAVFGYKNDFVWQDKVHNDVLYSLDDEHLEKGEMIWQANSLHIYERHFKYVKLTE